MRARPRIFPRMHNARAPALATLAASFAWRRLAWAGSRAPTGRGRTIRHVVAIDFFTVPTATDPACTHEPAPRASAIATSE